MLEAYLAERWPCLRLSEPSLADGSWVEPALAFLESAPPCPALPSDGARRVAKLLQTGTDRPGLTG